jgi:phosphatidylserine decarboxylase
MMSPKMFSLLFSNKIHPKAWFFVGVGAGVGGIFFLSGFMTLFFLMLVLTVAVLLFFRDPYRVISPLERGVVSPADGVVMEVLTQDPPAELALNQGKWKKIGIFLSPWHAHINRIPVAGTIKSRFYKKGAFAHVATEETRINNERLSLVIHTSGGYEVVCTQIAGFLARRIICDVQENDSVQMGEKYGIICFGSRVDLYLPESCTLLICEGQRVMAGETVLGFLPTS